MRQKPARGHAAKHSGTAKHGGTRKHHPAHHKAKPKGPATSTGTAVHVVRKLPGHAKPRKVTPGAVACCPAEAVAMAARLAGRAVSGTDVLDLYARCADGPSSGFTITAALTAGSRLGVVGFDLVGDLDECSGGLAGFGGSDVAHAGAADDLNAALAGHLPECSWPEGHVDAGYLGGNAPAHALILGVDLPGPHAVTVAPDGTWWSWGEPFDPAGWPGLAIEEAWAVTWR